MKAVMKTEWKPGVQVREIDEPLVADDEVLVKVRYAGVCGSDRQIYEAALRVPIALPAVIGHEFVGVITQVGERVPELRVGDRVVGEPGIVCRRCVFCNTGRHNLCANRKVMALSSLGAYAEFTKLPYHNLHIIEQTVQDEDAVLAEPSAVAVHAVLERGRIEPQENVLIVGPGTIGLLSLQMARIAGAARIIVSGTNVDEPRLNLAEQLGADRAINIETQNLSEEISAATGGKGIDLTIEATGNPRAIEQCLMNTNKGGRIINVGLQPRPLENLDINEIVHGEKALIGSWGSNPQDWDKAVSLINSKTIHPRRLVTDVLNLSDVDEAFQLMKQNKGIKILLKP